MKYIKYSVVNELLIRYTPYNPVEKQRNEALRVEWCVNLLGFWSLQPLLNQRNVLIYGLAYHEDDLVEELVSKLDVIISKHFRPE